MLVLLESAREIAAAQRKLEQTMRREFPSRTTRTIGYPSDNTGPVEILTNGSHWYYTRGEKGPRVGHPRRFNWFGLLTKGQTQVDITVEVNVPYEGRSGSVAGYFARETSSGNVYLMHSGRVGGGTKGISKDHFLAFSDLSPTTVVDALGRLRQGLFVMPVEGASATASAIRYVDTISHFKAAVREGALRNQAFESKLKAVRDYYAEARGRRRGQRSGRIDYVTRHGEIIDTLRNWRIASGLPRDARIVKNVFIDLGVATDGDLFELYEVKPTCARTDLYVAIGQLCVHAPKRCKRFLVLPQSDSIADDIREAIEALGIKLIFFRSAAGTNGRIEIA